MYTREEPEAGTGAAIIMEIIRFKFQFIFLDDY